MDLQIFPFLAGPVLGEAPITGGTLNGAGHNYSRPQFVDESDYFNFKSVNSADAFAQIKLIASSSDEFTGSEYLSIQTLTAS